MVLEKPPTSRIVGELYEVSGEQLKLIDDLEGHPTVYERKRVKVLREGSELGAWIYFYKHSRKLSNCRLVPSGDYNEIIPPEGY